MKIYKRFGLILFLTYLFVFALFLTTFKRKTGDCGINFIEKVPNNSSIIVGHAYGSPKNHGEFLSKNLERFLLKNYLKIENIIFTGDVFYSPSKVKWEKECI